MLSTPRSLATLLGSWIRGSSSPRISRRPPLIARKRTLFVIEGADSRSSSRSVSVCSRRFVALLKTAINPKKRRRDGIEREEEKEEETSPFIRLGFGEGASISLSHREGREPRITFHIASRLQGGREGADIEGRRRPVAFDKCRSSPRD